MEVLDFAHLSVLEDLHTRAMPHIIVPLTSVKPATGPRVFTLPSPLIVVKVTFVDARVCPRINTLSMRFIILEHAFVQIAVLVG